MLVPAIATVLFHSGHRLKENRADIAFTIYFEGDCMNKQLECLGAAESDTLVNSLDVTTYSRKNIAPRLRKDLTKT